jgi:hypothetical protein
MERDQLEREMLEQQYRVGKVLDIATKPAQWLIGGFEVLLLALIAVGIAVGTPIYYLFTGLPVTVSEVVLAITAVALLVLLFLSPAYVIGGGTLFGFVFGEWLWYHPHQTTFQSPLLVLIAFTAFGYFLILLGKLCKSLRH